MCNAPSTPSKGAREMPPISEQARALENGAAARAKETPKQQQAALKASAPPARVTVSEGASKRAPLVHRVLGSGPLKFYDNLLALAIGGQLGVLLRFYLTAASEGSFTAPLFSALSSNMVGCYWMGLVGDGKAAAQQMRRAEPDAEGRLLKEVEVVKKESLPLVSGLAVGGGTASALLGMRTGLCGSLTTFSSWNQSMVKFVIVDKDGWNAVVGYIVGLMVALLCLQFGQLTALYVQQRHNTATKKCLFLLPLSQKANSCIAFCGRHVWETRIAASLVFVVALVVEAWYAANLQCGSPNDRHGCDEDDGGDRDLMFGLFFSAFGVAMRWQLGRFNARCPSFPIGTFTANMVGAAVIGAIYGVRDDPVKDSYWASVQITSIALGFCGALSTVSTFVSEVNDRLRPIAVKGKAAPTCTLAGFVYAISTLLGGFVVGLAAYGLEVRIRPVS